MDLNILNSSRIASAAMVLIAVANKISAMMNFQSSPSNSDPSPIEAAARAHRNLFWGYFLWLLVAAIVTAVFTWLVWRASNKQQDLAMADAHTRIEVETAKVKVDAETQLKVETERIGIEGENRLKIETERVRKEAKAEEARIEAEAARKIQEARNRADVQIAEANERTQKVELQVAEQQERAARAERALLELQENLKPRSFTAIERAQLVEALRNSVIKGSVLISYPLGDAESQEFAREIARILREADWPVEDVAATGYGSNPIGEGIVIHDPQNPPPHALTLQRAFMTIHFNIPIARKLAAFRSDVELVIGIKARNQPK